MKRVRNSVRVLALALVLCMIMAMGVFAADNGSVWITETDTDDGTVAFIVTDATVTDGLVAVNYDAQKLTYQSVTVNESCVAMHAVNADEAGVVLISWVAPEAFVPEGNEMLIQVNFAGTSSEDVTLEGTLTGAEITDAPAVDKLALYKTVLQAQGLDEDNYTAESWAAFEKALAAAEAVLADPAATQAEVDAAVAALRAAIDALELADVPAGGVDKRELKKAIIIAEGLKKGNYTEYSWNALVEALEDAREVFDDPNATQAEVDAAAAALKAAIAGLKIKGVETGDDADLVVPIVLAVVCVVAIVAVLVVMNKKNKGGKA
ncbi:MAG: FIVAR domain-containing protein [Oscillospiraceae bacterium]|nr:FIVAR domain-containing protein [Oscillospiraceae bacterium]